MHETRTLASEETNTGTAVLPGSVPVVPGYKLGESIGRGGMGDVYRARDLELDREVAVKILQDRYPVDSGTAERFVAEARITAQLQHPGIPAVYRVSNLADGRPFLAMKLIKGQTLEELLKSKSQLNHLALIEAIAQALGYAHAHDVIHRDIKPANVMVGSFGEVQVMDWGLSKVLSPSRERERPESDPEATTATTLIRTKPDGGSSYTQYGSVLGTPAYMPPEQAGGETDRLCKASDVFGLGALWCKVLTGHPPIEGSDAEEVRRNAMRGKTEAALARLDACGAEPDVVALVKQCLAFEPKDRPADGNEVTKRVAAMRVAAEERAKQAELSQARAEVHAAEQAKRRRAMAWSAGAIVGVLLLGLTGTAVGLWYADTARRDADQKRTLAEEEMVLANAVKNFLQQDMLRLAHPTIQQQEVNALKYDADLRLRDVVLRAAEKIDGKFLTRPLVEAEIRHTLGFALYGMGEFDLAERQTKRALELREQHLGHDHPETLKTMSNLAAMLYRLAKYAESSKQFEKTLALMKTKLDHDDPLTLLSMKSLGDCYAALGKQADALKLREEAIARMKAKLGPDHLDTLRSKYSVADSYLAMGKSVEGLKLTMETLALMKAKIGNDHPDTLLGKYKLGASYYALGNYSEAQKIFEETLVLMKAKLGPNHPDTLSSMRGLADSFSALDKQADAFKLNEETLALTKAKLGPDHAETLRSMHSLAANYFALGKYAEALKIFQETLALMKVKLGPDHPDTVRSMRGLADSYFALGKYAEALKIFQETLVLMKAKLGPDNPDTLRSMRGLANSFSALDKQADAFKLREETLALSKAKNGPDHPETLYSMHSLAASYFALGKYAEALKIFEETLVLMKAKFGPDHSDTIESMNNLAIKYDTVGKHADALKLHEETLALRKAKFGPDYPGTLSSEWGVIRSLMALKRSTEALPRIDPLIERADKSAASGKNLNPQLIFQMYFYRGTIFRELKDLVGCRTTAERWEQRNPKSARELYNAACFRAVVAALQVEAKGSDSAAKAKADADQAMVWLNKAVAAGFKDRAHMENDTDLDYLRTRDDFKKLMQSLLQK